MLTNQKIEESLKNANLWFHSNNYFFGTIPDLKGSVETVKSGNKTLSRFLINLTENDIVIIPVVYAGFATEELLTEEKIDICSGDIEKVVVVTQNGYYYRLDVKKRDGEEIKITVNLLVDDFQRRNIIKFVENFKNEGAEKLYREEFRPGFSTSNYSNISSDAKSPLVRIFTILLFVYIIGFFAFVFAGILGYEDIFELFPLLIIGFIIVWVFGVLSSVSSVLKGINKDNTDTTNGQMNQDRPSFNQMSQEQREEAREKRQEDIITSSGPIVSNDENYGGIKKM